MQKQAFSIVKIMTIEGKYYVIDRQYLYFAAIRNAVLINRDKKGEDRDVNEKLFPVRVVHLV